MTSLDEGIREGAMAIFEEKYGESVRVVGIGDFSKELCGGVHVRATGEIGLFKIVSETSVAAGMRRIEAVTGEEAYPLRPGARGPRSPGIEKSLGVARKDLPARIDKLQARVDELEKETQGASQEDAGRRRRASFGRGRGPAVTTTVKGIAVLVRRMDGLTMAELRDTGRFPEAEAGSGVVVLGGVSGDKAFVVVTVTKDLTGRVQANALIKELAPVIGGGGGGRPDFAQSGGPGTGELDKALGSSRPSSNAWRPDPRNHPWRGLPKGPRFAKIGRTAMKNAKRISAALLLLALAPCLFAASAADLRKLYDPIIKKVAGKHGIDPELVHIIIRAESNYDTFAVSSAKGPWD